MLVSPRPGTAVAHDDGLVVVIDTELTDALRAEGDAREIQRAVQDLRREAGLDLADRIDLCVELGPHATAIGPYLDAVATETLADSATIGPLPADWPQASVKTSGGEVGVALRRAFPGSAPEPANA
jgi:isoleucyl-tRNA synthetase